MVNSPVESLSRREQIFETASALFSANGYSSTSVRDIARELDLQGGSLYAHIASKEQVLWEIISRVAAAFDAAVRPVAQTDATASERLRAMILAHVDVVVRHLSHATVFFQDWRHLSDARRAEILTLRDNHEALFRQAIADGVASGEFARRDPRLTAAFILTAMNGVAGWYRADGEKSAEAIAGELADIFIEGLTAKGSSA